MQLNYLLVFYCLLKQREIERERQRHEEHSRERRRERKHVVSVEGEVAS